jgi:hypothetical protein
MAPTEGAVEMTVLDIDSSSGGSGVVDGYELLSVRPDPFTIGSAPTSDTLMTGWEITVPAASESRTVLLSFSVLHDGSHAMRMVPYIDGTESPDWGLPSSGGGWKTNMVQDGAFGINVVDLPIDLDADEHVIDMRWQASDSTSGLSTIASYMAVKVPTEISVDGGSGTPLLVNIMPLVSATKTSTVGAVSGGLFDGNRDYSAYWTVGSGAQSVTIDYLSPIPFDHIEWVLYWGDGRSYHSVMVEASADGSTWTTLRAAADWQPNTTGADGLNVAVGASYQYLRFSSNGSTVNSNNEWVEIAVYANLLLAAA